MYKSCTAPSLHGVNFTHMQRELKKRLNILVTPVSPFNQTQECPLVTFQKCLLTQSLAGAELLEQL